MTVLSCIQAASLTAPEVLWHVRDGRACMAGVRDGETLYAAQPQKETR